MIDENTKIGCFFSKNLTIDTIPTVQNKEIIDIIQLHNKLITRINEGTFKKEDFLIFRNHISKENIIKSSLLIKLCNFYLDESIKTFVTEFNFLEKNGIIDVKNIMCNLIELNRKMYSYSCKFIDDLIPTVYDNEQLESRFKEYNNLLTELKDSNSDTYHYFQMLFKDNINSTFITPEFQKFFLTNEKLIYDTIINRLKWKIRNTSYYLQASKDSYFKEMRYYKYW